MRLFDVQDRIAQPPPPPVRVNGEEITPEEIAREVQNHPAETPGEARTAAIRALVIRELLLQAARKRGLIAAPCEISDGRRETNEDALVRQLLDEALDLPTPNEQECRRYYEMNIAKFRSQAIWEPAHILLAASPTDPRSREAARRQAARIIDILNKHPDQFAQLARDHSDCPSRDLDGSLGQVSAGQTTPEFEAALYEMEPGTISTQPVETPYGFHVIQLMRRSSGKTLPFSTVETQISDYLADYVFQRAVRQFISLLAGEAQIEGVEFERALSPLVQ